MKLRDYLVNEGKKEMLKIWGIVGRDIERIMDAFKLEYEYNPSRKTYTVEIDEKRDMIRLASELYKSYEEYRYRDVVFTYDGREYKVRDIMR